MSNIQSIPHATHPIAALATPRFKSALAIIRLTGDNCISLFEPFIKNPSVSITQWNTHTCKYCVLLDPHTQQMIDHAIVTVFRAPRSFTGQDVVEISLHGGLVVIDMLLDALFNNGFEQATPGEFTKRAFLNGKLDLTQAEAIQSIIESHTVHEHTIALQQLSGSISSYLQRIQQSIITLAATCAVCLDYPDDEVQEPTSLHPDEIQQIITSLSQAIQSYEVSRVMHEGICTVITGKTNAGKSTLFNTLLKEERAIVSDTHGTTRDFLEDTITIQGFPLRLFDTAGLRATQESIEQQGIEKSIALFSTANIILYIIDSSEGYTEEDITQLQHIIYDKHIDKDKIILVWNKIDLTPHTNPPHPFIVPAPKASDLPSVSLPHVVPISTTHYHTINKLVIKIQELLQHYTFLINEDTTVINSLRQKQHLEQCRQYLTHVLEGLKANQPLDMISLDIDGALTALGNITGEVSNEEILDVMFSNFCVGK